MGILIWFLILSSVSSRNWQAGCVQGLLGFISSSWRLWCIVPLIPQPVSQVPLVTTLLGSQNTRCWWEDPAPDFHTQWNYSLVWVWPPAAASSFPPASPFRSTWKPGCSPPPPSSTWVVGSSGDEPWSILGATCRGGAVRRDGDEKREEESSEGPSRKFWKLTCLCRGRRWYTWKLSARLYCSSKISTAMPVISSRDFDVHLMFLLQQNKYRLGPCYSCD